MDHSFKETLTGKVREKKVQVNSVTQSCQTLHDPVDCSTPGFSVHHQHRSFLKLMSIESVMLCKHLILCRSLLLLPSIFPGIRVFSNESVLRIRWPKYWRFSISPSNEYSELIFIRTDWFDLLAVRETLMSLLQQHSSKASILWPSAFFTVQLSHRLMITGKTIALTTWNFVHKLTSLFFRFVINLKYCLSLS